MSLDVVLLILRIAVAIALYAFVGAMFLFLRRDLRSAGTQQSDSRRPTARLVLVQVEEVPLEVGQSFVVHTLATLGRGSGNTIVIPDSFVSIEHAHIVWQRGQWWVEDRHSRNGTNVNNVPITEAVVLSSGDEIGIGRVVLRVELDPLA